MPAVARPACCVCSPSKCEGCETGDHCDERQCVFCLHGCVVPAGECCTPAPDDAPEWGRGPFRGPTYQPAVARG